MGKRGDGIPQPSTVQDTPAIGRRSRRGIAKTSDGSESAGFLICRSLMLCSVPEIRNERWVRCNGRPASRCRWRWISLASLAAGGSAGLKQTRACQHDLEKLVNKCNDLLQKLHTRFRISRRLQVRSRNIPAQATQRTTRFAVPSSRAVLWCWLVTVPAIAQQDPETDRRLGLWLDQTIRPAFHRTGRWSLSFISGSTREPLTCTSISSKAALHSAAAMAYTSTDLSLSTLRRRSNRCLRKPPDTQSHTEHRARSLAA
jgi:hypothetical protein